MRRPRSVANSAESTDEAALPAIPGVERFAHGADIGVRSRGTSLASALTNAALALTPLIVVKE